MFFVRQRALPFPVVLVFMDGLGIRPAMLEVGERLAQNGYSDAAAGSVLPLGAL